MSDFEEAGERIVMQQPGARLEVIYVPERAELTIRALAVGPQANSLVVEGSEGPFTKGSPVERGQLQIIGPAAEHFWKALNWQPPAAGDDPFEGFEPTRLG